MSHDTSFKSLSQFLTSALKASGAAVPDTLGTIRDAWRKVASSPLADHSQPVHLRSGRLLIETDSPAWANKIRNQEKGIIEQLNRRIAPILVNALRIRVLPAQMASPPPQSEPARRSPETRRLIESGAEQLSDPALKEAMRRLARKQS
jgi:predicted nucleic acid-binding Zn ribbon protein